MFVNKVAEALEKEFPNAKISTLAYLDTLIPPRTVRPRRNVVIQLCTDAHAWPNPLRPVTETDVFRNAMEAWHAIGAPMYIWDYTVNYSHFPLPMPNMPFVGDNIRYYVEHGAKGVLLQGAFQCAGGENGALRSWVWAKQLWDPSRRTLPLLRDFCFGYYGGTAEPMWQYNKMLWDMWENAHAAQLKEPDKPILPNRIRFPPTFPLLSKEYIERSADLFAQAMALAGDPETARRVEEAEIRISLHKALPGRGLL